MTTTPGKNGNINVLVVEDSPTQAEHLKFILEKAGYGVRVAANGNEALLLLETTIPDLVLSDIVMPEMDGYELCRRIKQDERFNRIPVVLVTALFDSQDVIRGLECGADNFIPKPYDEKYLLSRIVVVLAGSYADETEKVQIGLDISFAGKKHHITASRLQIVNMLLSTYETAVQKNQELTDAGDRLTESEALLNEVGEMAHIGGWELDVKTKAVYWTKETYRIHDISEDEKIGLSKAVLFYDLPDRSILEGALQRCMEKGEPFDLELPFTNAKGRHLWTRAIGRAVRVDGEVVKLTGTFQDITDYRQAEEALRESEQKFRHLFENSRDGIVIVDASTRKFVDSNETFSRMLGYNPEEIKNLGVPDIHPEDSLSRAAEAFEKMVKYEINLAENLPVKRKDGTVFYADISAYPLSISNKIYIVGVFRDITDRKQMENALILSEQTYRSYIDNSPEGIFVADGTGHYLDINRAACNLLGYSREEMLSMNVLDLAPPEERQQTLDQFTSTKERLKTESSVSLEMRLKKKDGSSCPVILSVVKLPNDAIMGFTLDITDRKRAEEALKESEEKYREFFTTSRDCVFITSPGGQWIDFNDVALEMFGYTSREELKKVPITQLYENPSARTAFLNLIIQQGHVKEFPLKLRRKDGTVIDTLITTVVVKNPDGSPRSFVGTVRDITDRKVAEEALHESEERYRTLAEASPDQIFIVGRDDTMKYVNPAVLKLFRLPYDHVIGKPRKELFPPEIAKSQEASIQKVFETGEITRKEELIQFGKLKIWIDTNLVPLKDEAGTVTSVLGIARDITKLKLAEEALWDSREHYRAIIDYSQIAIAVLDTNYKIIMVNPRFSKLFKKPVEDFVGKYCFNEFEKREAVCTHCPGMRAMVSGKPEEVETEGVLDDGSRFYAHNRAVPFFGPGGALQGFVEMVEDISERKKAEQSIRDSEEKFRDIFNNANDGIEIVELLDNGMPGRFADVNDVACRMLGYTREEMLRVSPLDIGTDYFSSPFDEIMQELHTTGHAIFETEHRGKDGIIVPVEVNTHKITLMGKTVFLSIVRDITERKLAEQSIHESELRYRTLIDSAAEGILVIDTETHKIRHANPAICRMLGYSEEELTTLGMEHTIPKESMDYVMGEFMAQMRGKKPLSMNVPLLRKDKTIQYTDVKSARVLIDEKMSIVGFFTDITERKKSEDLLKRFNEELEQKVIARTEQLNASLDEKVILLREVHHRVNNNLQILISLMNLQSRTVTDPKVIEALTESTQRIRAMSMVHEKLYAGSDLAHIDFVSYLSSLAQSQVAFYRIDPRKVTFETTKEPIMLAITTAIPLGLVMNELISNALKHAFPGDRKGTIRINARETAGQIEITLADDGIGLPEGFDYTNSPSLGLRLVNILIEQLSGTITLDRTAGTAFNIVLKEKE